MNRTGYLRRFIGIGIAAIAASLAAPGCAQANAGIPMLGYAWPLAWALLLPVIALEALVARRVLRASWPVSVKLAGLTNLISTLAGIPLAWAAVLLLGSRETGQ